MDNTHYHEEHGHDEQRIGKDQCLVFGYYGLDSGIGQQDDHRRDQSDCFEVSEHFHKSIIS